ncbi:MAG: TetR/AcrR family transcriptional regulator [Actinoplanes sp.]
MPRGRPPAHTREQVVAAAIKVADAEGLEALTMRRLAAELGAGVMSLYTYVKDKDDLVDLMVEQAGEYAGPGPATLLALVKWQRSLMLKHPWMLSALPNRNLVGPNTLGYLERGLAALADKPLPGAVKMEILALLTGFVAGYVANELAQARAGVTPLEQVEAHVTQMRAALATGAFPELAKVLAEGGTAAQADLPDFDRIATRMIDGLVRG